MYYSAHSDKIKLILQVLEHHVVESNHIKQSKFLYIICCIIFHCETNKFSYFIYKKNVSHIWLWVRESWLLVTIKFLCIFLAFFKSNLIQNKKIIWTMHRYGIKKYRDILLSCCTLKIDVYTHFMIRSIKSS